MAQDIIENLVCIWS